ncbi:choice-of-anchor I family protein [Arcobacter sp. LA11]|uniref:choice-of-anchor I family protein n=1 Tax=Arcobacter sp. LA11 TaxID=1898176 RepID=UPI00093339BB|nr:choice-of-anchor I family protein [Arcobacter sp. LA11]
MKKSYLSLSACAVLATFMFVGCGGSSSGSSSSSTSSGTLSLNPNLANIDYTCGSISGVTGTNGEYSYKSGDTCTFTIGGLELSATPSSNLTIEKIAEANENVSSDALAAYIIAKMSKKSGETYDINNLPDTFTLPEDIEGDTGSPLDFTSMDSLIEDLPSDLKDKVETVKFDIRTKFANKVEVKFEEIATPTTEETKTTQQASSKATINGTEQSIGYTTIMKTGDTDNSEIFGLVKDYTDAAITFEGDNSPYICNGTNDGVGSGLDYSSFLNVNDKLYMVSQFECQIGAMYMTELEQNATTGALSAKEGTLKFISQKDEFGGFVHCAGQKTPWESHLGSEEYETDARGVEEDADENGVTGSKYYDETAKFWKNDATLMSPYYYGWTPEVKIDSSGNAQYSKHYSMGRFSHELSYVMPDEKTVYLSDDGTNVGFFMFIADTAKDLSTGTLYAAKWNQVSEIGVGAGEANITWINLGHATNTEIRAYLDPDNDISTNDALVFSDIFETVEPSSGTCATGYTAVNTSSNYDECLKVKTGMEKAASRLETRRYAAIMGATTEFRKEEGITFDKNSGKLYVAMSSVERGMEDNKKSGVDNTKYDIGGNNDIKVEYNKCGAVYALDVNTQTAMDTDDNTISSSFVVKNMKSIIEGTPVSYADTSIYAENSCDVNGISNPDNVAFLDNSDILMIGEDTSKHENNVVWAYNVKTKELTRTFTTPTGAETTSPFWYSDLKNGFGYMSVVTQHPDNDDKESAIGYVGPFKNLADLKESNSINSINKIASYETSVEGGSEIVAFDKDSNKVYTTNGDANALDISTLTYNSETKATTIVKVSSIDLSTYGDGVNSVAVSNGKVAVAVEKVDSVDDSKQLKGSVVIFDTTGTHLKTVEAGYLPDMVTFNEDGTKIVVANEGEPNSDYSYDPVGTVGVIDIASDYAYTDIGFDGVTIPAEVVLKDGVDASLDLEPEYITISGTKAYVTLQENNALAIVDISTNSVDSVVSLGFKDHSLEENSIDIEEEGETLLKTYTGLYGMYQPDSIDSYKIGTKTYLVTANEGDGREYGDYENETKISKLSLDSSIASAYTDENDLKVNNELGKVNDSYTKLYTFGARSFSIWDEMGALVFDSKNELAKLTSKFEPELFNHDDGEKDGRSGNKGVEPEALAVGEVNDKTYAFVGLERQSAIVIYDISTPENAKFVRYIDTKTADISPEGMKFISKEDSPTGNALLLVAFEVSGSTVAYEIK